MIAAAIVIAACFSYRDFIPVEELKAQNDAEEDSPFLKALKEARKNTPPDPLTIMINKTETARTALPPISAPSPVQFNVVEQTGGGYTLDEIPFTRPGQIHIDIIVGSGERKLVDNFSDFTPLGWSGSILYDKGKKQKSIGGSGWDRLIMDCTPGTPFGISFQKDSKYGYLEVDIQRSEIDINGDRTNILDFSKPFYAEGAKTFEPYGIVSISDICPPLDQ